MGANRSTIFAFAPAEEEPRESVDLHNRNEEAIQQIQEVDEVMKAISDDAEHNMVYLGIFDINDLCGKSVAVFGVGDSVGYGDSFCEALEELHSTFEAADAKMLGYVSADSYQHSQSESVADGKFVGLPLDQDNEDDMTADRVKAWISQINGEGMSVMVGDQAPAS